MKEFQRFENVIHRIIENVYNQGYEDGQKEKLANAMIHDHEEAEKKAYEDGMNAAWEAARKIHDRQIPYEVFGLDKNGNGFTYASPLNWGETITAQEVIAKIKAYEDKQKDKVKETDLEIKPPKADCDKCVHKGFCGHPEPIKEVVRENGCYGFIPF